MKFQSFLNCFFWLCNALTFAVATTVGSWLMYRYVSMHLPGIQTMEASFICTKLLLITYAYFVAWKTGQWLWQPGSKSALHFLWYWAGALLILLIMFFFTAAFWMGSRSPVGN